MGSLLSPLWLGLLLGLLLGQAAPAEPPAAQPGPAPVADAELARHDLLWARRDEPAAAAELAAQLSRFERSESYERLWRAARWYGWLAGGEQGEAKKRDAKRGWEVGERAKAARPEGLEGQYWTAIDCGFWGGSVSVFEAFGAGIEGKFHDPLFALTKRDPQMANPHLDYVGPESSLGHFYYKLPWPKQDKDQARRWLQQALAAHPEILRTHYLLADVLKDDDRAAALRELRFVIAAQPALDPPDDRRSQALARSLLQQLSK